MADDTTAEAPELHGGLDAERFRTDAIGATIEYEGDTGDIIPDPRNGYDRVVLEPDVLAAIVEGLCKEIEDTDREYEPQLSELAANQLVYEAKPERGETIGVPVAKTVTNQQVAWISTAILSKTPYITVNPIDGGSYEIPMGVESGDPRNIQPGAELQTVTVTSEEAAKLYQDWLQFKFSEKLEFEQLIDDTVAAIHQGEAPTWWKIYRDENVRIAKSRKFQPVEGKSNVVRFVGLEETTIYEGETVKIDHCAFQNITMPLDENDHQRSRWLSEKSPHTNQMLWEGFKNNVFDFARKPNKKGEVEIDPREIRDLLGFAQTRDDSDTAVEQQVSYIDKRVALQPHDKHDVRIVWFYAPIKRTVKEAAPLQLAPVDGEEPAAPRQLSRTVIEMRSLCGTLHLKSRKMLNLYINPYWHGKRPYVPFFMRKKAHRFTGNTAVGDIAPIQRLISQIFHLEIANGVQQNVKVFLVRENSSTQRFLKRNALKPGLIIPYESPDDVNPVQLGSQVQSMAPQITFLNGVAQRLSVVTDYDLGADVPNRTPAATVSQIEQMAKMQPQQVLRSVRRSIAKAASMYLQTAAQYHVFETMPFLDERQSQLTQKLLSFPQDDIEKHFSFRVTATGDEDTEQARVEKWNLISKATDEANLRATKMADSILDPRLPAPNRQFNLLLFKRSEAAYAEILKALRPDYKRFVIDEKQMTAFMQQADSLFAIQQAAAAAAAAQNPQGVPSGENQQLPPAGLPNALPQLPAGPGGPGNVPGEPGNEGGGEPMAPEGAGEGGPPL